MLADGAHQRTASTGPGQKSHVERRKASVPVAGIRKTPHRKPGWLARSAHIDRGHGGPVVRNERKAGSFARACRSMGRLHAGHGVPIWVRRRHPSATGAPHAPREGRRNAKKGKWREKGEGNEKRANEIDENVGWAKAALLGCVPTSS